jgi:rhodanese-related sulfurtransferase
MNIRFYINIIVGLSIVKFAFAEVIDVDDQEMIKLSNDNIPIVDVRRSSEWDQTGVIPNSILLTFFDEEGNYNFDEWYEKLQLEINVSNPIILICRSGKRSKIIAKMMDKEFDIIIYNAQSGINSWINKKLITVEPQTNSKMSK